MRITAMTPGARTFQLLLAWAILATCGGGDVTPPDPSAPVITVGGVTDGAVIEGAVTITVDVDVGTYSATLNGNSFTSGTVVSEPGMYVLVVTARNGTAISTETVTFEIRFGGDSVLIIRMFDLGPNESGGGGDAVLVTDSTAQGQRHALFDAGPQGMNAADRGFVQRQLDLLGVDTLEALVLSHAHEDHYLGMPDVLRETHVRRFYHNGQVRTLGSYEEVLALALTDAEERIAVGARVDLSFGLGGETTLRFIPPLATFLGDTDDGSELNEGSLGVSLERGAFTMLFTGDGEVQANQRWSTQFGDETGGLTVLKVGHHGANDAVSAAWLAHTAAELQLVTANGTTHPRIGATALLLGRPAETYCTNVHGRVEVRVDEAGEWIVSVERNAGLACTPGDDATT